MTWFGGAGSRLDNGIGGEQGNAFLLSSDQ